MQGTTQRLLWQRAQGPRQLLQMLALLMSPRLLLISMPAAFSAADSSSWLQYPQAAQASVAPVV